ncbi:MAG TPA: sulfatase-like hydrolase/transferase [Gammaproteobacteria bacterium]|nr:sulfatase-like hydrolase/transferase [Gammaproteobacteria bacterium]
MTHVDALVFQSLSHGLGISALIGALFTLLLLIKSVFDFSRTGPHMAEEVMSHYRFYLVYSLARLALFVFLITTFMAFLGVIGYAAGLILFGAGYNPVLAAGAGLLAVFILTLRQFIRTLLYSPGVIASSSLYSMTHFYPLWEQLTPTRLYALDIGLFGILGAWLAVGMTALAREGAWPASWLMGVIAGLYLAILLLSMWEREPRPVRRNGKSSTPNILLIGSDTLRADRLSGMGYPRELTPTLDAFARRASRFTDCYVPCARTAPSIASMLTGTWPHTHGIRDTFVTPEEAQLPVAGLPEILEKLGYQTAVVGDWAASDMSKLSFNFKHEDLPHDQWNIKYLLRQGPKDLRLFLSLFTQNWFGKTFLPEIYYLGGIPLTEEIGRDTRRMIAKLAKDDAPFFMVSFMATTHPPFTSKYPYYAMYADQGYQGESKFAMARLRDPFEIIRRQGEPKTEFDLDQIIDLYDGCVRNFDDELKRILDYLEVSGLAEDTIVVIFSDHGFEFFEHETWGQGNSAIGDFSARVPLLIADPRKPQSRMISNVVRTVDLAPTLLELVGSPIPDYMEGVSLTPLMRGEPLPGELPAFYETGVWLTDLPGSPEGHLRYPSLPGLLEVPDKKLGMICLKPHYQDVVVVAKDRMVRLGEWKLTYQPLTDGALYQLFNIREDAACRHNVIDQNPLIAQQLRILLARWMNDNSAPNTFSGDDANDSKS